MEYQDMSKTFTGIGSRQTPPEILEKMKAIAKFLSERGYTLRSGSVDGLEELRAFCKTLIGETT